MERYEVGLVTPENIASLVRWNTKKRTAQLFGHIPSTHCLPDQWGSRATKHAREFLDKYPVEIDKLVKDRIDSEFIGVFRDSGDLIKQPIHKTSTGPLKNVVILVCTYIAQKVNECIKEDIEDDYWCELSQNANSLMEGMEDRGLTDLDLVDQELVP